MTQNTEYFGLYRNSRIRCDVTPTSRIWNLEWLVGEDLRHFSGIQPYRESLHTGARSFTETAYCLGDFETTEIQVANPAPLTPQAKSLTTRGHRCSFEI